MTMKTKLYTRAEYLSPQNCQNQAEAETVAKANAYVAEKIEAGEYDGGCAEYLSPWGIIGNEDEEGSVTLDTSRDNAATPDDLNDIISRAIKAIQNEPNGTPYKYADNAEEIQEWGETAFALITMDAEWTEPMDHETARATARRLVELLAKKNPCPERE